MIADDATRQAWAPSQDVAARYQRAAMRAKGRADRIRLQGDSLGESLMPLRSAMRRRACELELTSTVLAAVADATSADPAPAGVSRGHGLAERLGTPRRR